MHSWQCYTFALCWEQKVRHSRSRTTADSRFGQPVHRAVGNVWTEGSRGRFQYSQKQQGAGCGDALGVPSTAAAKAAAKLETARAYYTVKGLGPLLQLWSSILSMKSTFTTSLSSMDSICQCRSYPPTIRALQLAATAQ